MYLPAGFGCAEHNHLCLMISASSFLLELAGQGANIPVPARSEECGHLNVCAWVVLAPICTPAEVLLLKRSSRALQDV